MSETPDNYELPGLKVNLDRLIYHFDPENGPEGCPHLFVYFITIKNLSDRTVKLMARKWIIRHGNGETEVIEGDRIVGEEPRLAPGEHFTYNSYHAAKIDCVATGSYHGVDQDGQRIYVRIPEFEMLIPEKNG